MKTLFLALAFAASLAHAAPGDVDALNAGITGSYVNATAVQPDGKIIIGGIFTAVLGVPRSNIARLNTDGTLDTGFDPKANGEVFGVAVQPDGKVLFVGSFTTLQPNGGGAATSRQRIARVNADGTLDTSFDPNANLPVLRVTVQADGKVLLGGTFTTLQPNGAGAATSRQRIARVNADGTLDTSFDPKANNSVYGVAVQADGKLLLGGSFTTLQPNGAGAATSRQRIARVNADGTLDTGFVPTANDWVYCVAVQADGKVLLGGLFTTLQPNGASAATTRNRIARLNADGTLDTDFDPNANSPISSVVVQADGKVLLGGGFSTLQPNGALVATSRPRIARVNADGTLAPGFDPYALSSVRSVAVQADGKVILGGNFTSLLPNGAATLTARNFFARLVNDPATQTLTGPEATQALWQRGGSAPEVSRVSFELSTDGGASWSPLGPGNRIGTTANWQLTGLSLPASARLRARGATTGGFYNGSSGIIEQVVSLHLQQWKLTHLSDADAANDGDTDFDGLRTILEYATGGDPLVPGALPLGSAVAGKTAITFPRNTAATGVTLTVQGSDDLSTWTDLARSTAGAAMVALVGGVTVTETGAGPLLTVEVRDLYPIGDPAHPQRFLRLHAAP